MMEFFVDFYDWDKGYLIGGQMQTDFVKDIFIGLAHSRHTGLFSPASKIPQIPEPKFTKFYGGHPLF